MSVVHPVVQIGGVRAYGLTRSQHLALIADLRRYYTWELSGRRVDPWASGVGRGHDLSRPRVRTSAPGSAPPPSACEPETDALLLTLARLHRELAPLDQYLARWKSVGDGDLGRPLRCEAIAERLGFTERRVARRWRQLSTELYYRLREGEERVLGLVPPGPGPKTE